MWLRFSSFILRQRTPILIVLGILTAFMLFNARKVKMNYEMYVVLPPEDSTFQEFERFKSQFGQESSVLVMGIEGAEILELQNFIQWQKTCSALKEIDGVDEVLALPTVALLKKNSQEKRFELQNLFQREVTSQPELDSLLNAFNNLPFYKGLIYNDSANIFLTAITLDRERLDSKDRGELMGEIMADCHSLEQKIGKEFHYSGLPHIRSNTTSQISKEIEIFIILAALITMLILFLFFRSMRATLFSMLVVLVGVAWAMGWMGLFGYKITMLTGLIPPLIIVIGIPNCIFLLNKYHQEFKTHGNQVKALSRVIQKIGNAIFLTNLTTSLGIAAFIFTKSRILVEFGIVTSISIMSVFVLSITLIPIFFSFSKPPVPRHTRHLENRWMRLVIQKMEFIVLNKRNYVYAVTIVILAVSIFGMTLIKTTGNISDDLPKDSKVYTDLLYLEKHFNGVIPFEVMIDTKKKGKALQASTLKKIDKLQKTISEYKMFSKPLSIVDGVKFSRQAFYNNNVKKYDLFNNQDKSFLAPYLSSKGQRSKMLNSFVDSNRRVTRIAVQMRDINTEEMDAMMATLKPQVDSIFNPEKYNVTLTGTSVIFLEGTKYLVKNLFTSLLLAIVVIALLMALLFNSARMVIMSLVPNLLPLVVTAGSMGYFGIPLKPSTILIFSIAFGISIDDTIHYLAKFRQELKGHHLGFKMAVLEALRETGISMIYTSVVLFFGFSVFTVSDFGGTVALGMLVSFTLFVAMNANLILLPSLLLSLDKRITTKAIEHESLFHLLDEEEEDINTEDLRLKKDGES
ncbi:MAG: efflux RND transporter permease subunit [Vicingaceae bacterium]